MPYNILIFIARKSGISHSEFKEHYETSHMPLLRSYGGEHFPKSHRRHYLHVDESDQPTILLGNKGDTFEYDAVAEVGFDDKAAFHAFIAVLKVEEASKEIRADEDKFVDREKMKTVLIGDVVQETRT